MHFNPDRSDNPLEERKSSNTKNPPKISWTKLKKKQWEGTNERNGITARFERTKRWRNRWVDWGWCMQDFKRGGSSLSRSRNTRGTSCNDRLQRDYQENTTRSERQNDDAIVQWRQKPVGIRENDLFQPRGKERQGVIGVWGIRSSRGKPAADR